MGNTNPSLPTNQKSEVESICDALDELRHTMSRALTLALSIDDGECAPSMEMVAYFAHRMEEIRTMKQTIGAHA
jgi:hypothetical protein